MARPTPAAGWGIRRGPLRSVHALPALLLTLLAATVMACGLAGPGQGPPSMTSAGSVAMTGDARSASAMGYEGDDKCRQATASAGVSSYEDEDCGRAPCAQASGQSRPWCCDSPGPNGVSSTPPTVASPIAPGSVPPGAPITYQPRCPDARDSGPGPPDLHMLQLLRV